MTKRCLVLLFLLSSCAQLNPISGKASFLTEDRNTCFKKCDDDYLCQKACDKDCDKYGCGENKGKKGVVFGD